MPVVGFQQGYDVAKIGKIHNVSKYFQNKFNIYPLLLQLLNDCQPLPHAHLLI